MKEQAYNIIKIKDSRTQRQSNLNKSKEARFKILPQEFEDHTVGEIVSLKYVYEHGSSKSVGYLLKETSEYDDANTSDYYNKSKLTYGLFVDNIDDQEIFHDANEHAHENFDENHVVNENDHNESESINSTFALKISILKSYSNHDLLLQLESFIACMESLSLNLELDLES
ncbi:hypothetical protein Tco_0462038 [Tanacetum coccineum]